MIFFRHNRFAGPLARPVFTLSGCTFFKWREKMGDENYFDESDFQKIRAKSAHGGVQSELHIPRACLTCDGEPRRERDCLGACCPIFPIQGFNSKETDEDQYISDLLADHRMLKEVLLEARVLKESLRATRLLNLAG
jgi:hypothetical protein